VYKDVVKTKAKYDNIFKAVPSTTDNLKQMIKTQLEGV
jgi:hypothetical protein